MYIKNVYTLLQITKSNIRFFFKARFLLFNNFGLSSLKNYWQNCFLWYWKHWLKDKIKVKFMNFIMRNIFVSKHFQATHIIPWNSCLIILIY